MYESPITAIYKETLEKIIQQRENAICETIREKMDIRVDPQELKKALAYDRDQYKKGWEDAKRTYKAPDAEWILNDTGWNTICNNCGEGVWRGYIPKPSEAVEWMPRCPQCGAIMKKPEQEARDGA